MRKRREARERAVQFLFQYDLNPPENLPAALDHFWETQRTNAVQEKHPGATWGERIEVPPASPDDLALRLFADGLITGVIQHLSETDEIIRKFTQNWELNRLAVVDRNVLRLAIFEMLHRDDIPPIVSINEAVDIAKKFSTDQSGKFVNGILDKVKDSILRPARTAKPQAES